MDFSIVVREAAKKRFLFLPHAITQMNSPERMITTDDVREVVIRGEIIEDYPNDPRGHSCLMLGWSKNRPIHVVCAPKDEYLAVITAYVPSASEWESGFRKRVG